MMALRTAARRAVAPMAMRATATPMASRAFATDVTPMTIADRAMAEAVSAGKLDKLSGAGKPLKDEPDTQVHAAKLSQNMDARAEAEMRRADREGYFSNLHGKGEKLPDRHASGSSAAAVNAHVQKSAH